MLLGGGARRLLRRPRLRCSAVFALAAAVLLVLAGGATLPLPVAFVARGPWRGRVGGVERRRVGAVDDVGADVLAG